MYSTFRYKSSILDKNYQINPSFLSNLIILLKIPKLEDVLFSLPKSPIKVLDYLFHLRTRFNSIYVSQARIGSNANITRRHVNRCIKILVRLGLITKTYRFRRTSIYRFTGLFFKNKLLLSLLKPMKALKKLIERNVSLASLCYKNKRLIYKSGKKRWSKEALIAGGKYMESMLDQNTSKAMSKCIPVLCLSRRGVAQLLPFPEFVIAKALESYNLNCNKAFNKFEYFMGTCIKICREYGIRPDWSLKDKVLTTDGISKNEPFTTTARNLKKNQSQAIQKREVIKPVNNDQPVLGKKYSARLNQTVQSNVVDNEGIYNRLGRVSSEVDGENVADLQEMRRVARENLSEEDKKAQEAKRNKFLSFVGFI